MPRASHSARTSRRLATALALTGAIAYCGQAAALPPGPPPIINLPPVAALTGTPNPVVVPTPIAIGPVAGVEATAFRLGTAVAYSAAGSVDLDGSIESYEWDLDGLAGFEKTTATPTLTQRYSSPGVITARVRVTDDDGASRIATLAVTRHYAPSARITPTKTVAVMGEGITFTSASTDADGIASLEWDLDGDGTFERTGAQANTSFGTTGPHTVALRATDNLGARSVGSVTVRVHRAPTALIVTQPTTPIVGRPTTLDGSRSSDDGAIAKYEWDLNGDGTFETNTAAVPTATTTFATVGPATVGLRVTDADGATDQSSLTLQVAATPAPTAPVATIDSLASSLRPLGTRLRMSAKGRIALRVACPATEQVCGVAVTVRGIKGALAGRSLGRARSDIQGGRTATISIPLSRRAQASAARGSLRARVVISTTDASGNLARTRTVVSIRK